MGQKKTILMSSFFKKKSTKRIKKKYEPVCVIEDEGDYQEPDEPSGELIRSRVGSFRQQAERLNLSFFDLLNCKKRDLFF